jgi:DNA-binding MarR family transcriptional regulator
MTVDIGNKKADGIRDVRELLWFKIASLASYTERLSQPHFSEQLGMTLREWRTLATIAYLQPATLMRLVDESLLDKGQTSRVVTTLIERGWVARASAAEGIQSNKGLTLSLTPTGRRIHRRGLDFADRFTQKTREQLSADENAELLRLLDKLMGTVRVRMQALHQSKRRPT